MHIRPFPLGAIIVGIGFISNAVFTPVNQFMRSPVWFMQNWPSILKGSLGWFIVGAILLVGGLIALLV